MSIELNQAVLQEHFATACGETLYLSLQHSKQNKTDFTALEAEKLAAIGSEKRKAEYTLGRHALKEVLGKIGRDTDTGNISWPSAYCSLSHCDGYAVAVSSLDWRGIGVDLQLNKTPPAAMAERILSERSLAYWQALPDQEKADALQRLWTVNEAIYKACPVPQPANFRHYQLRNPESMHSDAAIDDTKYQFTVRSAKLENGYITVALRR